MGKSGAGKSTLINILGTLEKPTAGSYVFNGCEIQNLSENQKTMLRLQGIGFVFQGFHLIPYLTCGENIKILLGICNSRMKKSEIDDKVHEVANKVGISHRLKHLPTELSYGEQQRTAIARCLINKPKLILADEPTGNLDSLTSMEIVMLIKDIVANEGVTCIMVTHDEKISGKADHRIYLNNGILTIR
jgi:ABC-type lipoprotein export system ATPase subunit